MRPLTLERPKPLIPVLGRPILEHIVRALPEEIDELILVIGYKGEMIREHCGEEFCGRRVRYVVQEDPKAGTGAALFGARDLLKGRFLIMYGDDIHGSSALAEAVRSEHALLAARAERPERFGVIEQHEDGTLERIVEKPEHPSSDLVSIGGFVLSEDIFSCVAERSERLGEQVLVDNVNIYATRHPVQVIEQDRWIPIGYPEDIERAERLIEADPGMY